MRIGELAERTGASRRLLRYYEEQGLIRPSRRANGYRDYDEQLVDRVRQIRGLLAAGLPTRIIKLMLPCLSDAPGLRCPIATAEWVARLERERDQLAARVEELARNRDAMTEYIKGMYADLPDSA
jgi:DNA-binding transcriptional MerR regulator